MLAPDAQIWPVSVAGWITLFIAVLTLIGGVFALGKFFYKLEEIIDEMKVNNVSLADLQDRFTIVEHTLWGPKGDNGMSSQMREIRKRVDLIQERNTKIDATRAREQGAIEAGGESRFHNRRTEDKIIRGEDDA